MATNKSNEIKINKPSGEGETMETKNKEKMDEDFLLANVVILKILSILFLIAGIVVASIQKNFVFAIGGVFVSVLLYALSHIVNYLNKISDNLEAIKNKTTIMETNEEKINND